jgi:predicted nucleic acid-binding protein
MNNMNNRVDARTNATVLPKNRKDISEKVEQVLEESSKGISSDVMAWIKKRFESNIHLWIGENLGKINVSLVADSSVIIQSIKYHAKGKTSILYHLAENHLFPIYTPKEAEAEVLDYIENKAKKNESKTKLRKAWKNLKPILKIREVMNSEAKKIAKEMIRDRDPNDAPFIGLYFELGATAVLTSDRDYESATVRKFNIAELNDVVAVFHKGFFSFFIMNDITPLVLEGLSKLVMAIAKVLFGFLKQLFEIGVGVISGAFEKIGELISKIPKNAQKWITVGLFAAAAAVLLATIFYEGARKKVTGAIKSVWNNIKPVLEKIVNWLTNIINSLIHYAKLSGPYIGTSVEILAEIQSHIAEISEKIKNLGLESANFA